MQEQNFFSDVALMVSSSRPIPSSITRYFNLSLVSKLGKEGMRGEDFTFPLTIFITTHLSNLNDIEMSSENWETAL